MSIQGISRQYYWAKEIVAKSKEVVDETVGLRTG
jgi:hypothetical protein